MLPFEKNVIHLFKANNLEFKFSGEDHYLKSEKINIQFIPNCSFPAYAIARHDYHQNQAFTLRIWQDIYEHQPAIVSSRILAIIGVSERIYARSTVIKVISQLELNEFITKNHLNIATMCKYRYGMFYKDKIVAVAAFGRSCPIQDDGVTYLSNELIRYCSMLNHTVVGGLSKFIKYFEVNNQPQHLMTYVDREWSQGKSYLQLGFSVDSITPPQTFWLEPKTCSRVYANQLPTNKTTAELYSEGWRSLENLGNIKLVKFL